MNQFFWQIEVIIFLGFLFCNSNNMLDNFFLLALLILYVYLLVINIIIAENSIKETDLQFVLTVNQFFILMLILTFFTYIRVIIERLPHNISTDYNPVLLFFSILSMVFYAVLTFKESIIRDLSQIITPFFKSTPVQRLIFINKIKKPLYYLELSFENLISNFVKTYGLNIFVSLCHLIIYNTVDLDAIYIIFSIIPRIITAICFFYDLIIVHYFYYFYYSLYLLIMPLLFQLIVYIVNSLCAYSLKKPLPMQFAGFFDLAKGVLETLNFILFNKFSKLIFMSYFISWFIYIILLILNKY